MSDAARATIQKMYMTCAVQDTPTLGEMESAFEAFAAEQTAALREDNARLRGAAMALVEWCEHDYGDMRMCRVCAGMAIRRDEAVPHAECPVARLGALLADPEGL